MPLRRLLKTLKDGPAEELNLGAGTAFTVIVRVGSYALVAVAGIVVARALGAHDRGVYSLVFTIAVMYAATSELGVSYAGIYFVTTTLLFYTLGVFLASLGHMTIRAAFLGLLRIPTMYAVLLAIIINVLNIRIPTPVARAVELAAGGTIPLMLILLGVQLTRVEFSGNLRALQLSVSLRLVIAPLAALLFAALFGLQGFTRQGSVTQASMPSMVSATVLATEYDLDARLVTAVVFISTLLSPLTLTPLLVFLGRS